MLATRGLGAPCQLLVTGGLGVCKEGASYPIREARYQAGLSDFRKQLLREDFEIIELLSAFFSTKRRMN